MKLTKKWVLIKLMMQRGFGLAFVMVAALTVIMIAPDVQAEEKSDLKISGFVDVSYSDVEFRDSTFGLDSVEIDVEKKMSSVLSIRADIDFTSTAPSALLEQGYVTLGLPTVEGLIFTIGQFNAPIGFELLDAPDMYQYSHSLVFDNGLPTNLSGVMASYPFNDMVDLSLYVVNGWDNNSDNNEGKTLGGRLGISPVDGVNIGLSAISGADVNADNTDKKTVIDVDLTITAVENLTIGAEYNSGTADKSGTATGEIDSKWTGYLVMAHYDFTDTIGLTVRYDNFDDEGGSVFDATDALKETRESITIAPTFSLGDGAGMLVEYRQDKSDLKVFGPAGSMQDTQDTIAVEFTYSF